MLTCVSQSLFVTRPNILYETWISIIKRYYIYFVLVKCHEIDTVDGGNVTLTSNGINAIALFTCKIGSSLNGSSTSTCDSNGFWEIPQPLCGILLNV